ncbi:glycoside hydrolase family protein [Tamlana sp. 2201CG12-4]|uniref:glycoside hydrolase family protein n=1 Tax=Tamlana sp. 2201CG12-4 TaxID=3112582 RepID=UPI002DB9FC7D|nr:glycoside hydrolase family protein [Tamlana sp. 2201CG12-4]MEC3908260.1 glycoside hydrolase family protein [Tamlana sp. 2201CG12-4]
MRVLFLALILLFTTCKQAQNASVDKNKIKTQSIDDFSKLLKRVPKQSILAQEGYYVWGGSVVKGDDGFYHMLYSRWLKSYGFEAWVTHSEIAHAISKTPEGPFTFVDVALQARGKTYWDGLTTHNPTVYKFEGKYYLYYMGTTGDGKVMPTLNFIHRNNQRIGVAWANSPNGPWNRFDKPVIDVSEDPQAYDALMVSNPSVTKMKDGRILLIYKAVARHNPLPFGGPVTHLASVSDNPLGTFKKFEAPIFYKEGEKFPAEDPYIWYQESADQYYAIVKDMEGAFTNAGTSLALFKSNDGFDWQPAENALVSKIQIEWEDGTLQKLNRLERPQILLEDGSPKMLYCAAMYNGETVNVHMSLVNLEK